MAFEFEVEELEQIRLDNDGLLTVSAVVEAARNEASALHKHFDWDDNSAAEKYREWQARTLIQKCRVTLNDREETVIRAYVSVPTDRKEGGYRAVHEVLEDSTMRESLLMEIRKRVSYWQTQHYLLSGETMTAIKRLERTLGQDEVRISG